MKKWFKLFRQQGSGSIAKERLHNVLIADRVACSPVLLKNIKEDVSASLVKYIEIDSMNLDIFVEEKTKNHLPLLIIKIPFNQKRLPKRTGEY